MKKNFKIKSVILIIGVLLISCNQTEVSQSNSQTGDESKFPVLKGPYLGQTPPGDVPELFAPGIVADIYREHSAAAFTPDGKEVFWTRVMNQGVSPRLMVTMHMKQENGVWIEPELAPFNEGSNTIIESISSDGKRLYFSSFRPIEKGGNPQNNQLVVDKTEDGWGEPRMNNLLSNWKMKYILFQETRNGNLYFQSDLQNVDYKIGFFRSKIIDGKYQQPEALGETINSKHLDYAFHVDPSEKFIIFASRRPGGFAETDLYISYHQADDSWGPAINLGSKINSFGAGGTSWPYLSPDGKYLFFVTAMQPYNDIDEKKYSYAELKKISLSYTNGYGKIYWVSTGFIEELRPKDL